MSRFSDELYGDMHKDAYGVRPSETGWATWQSLSDDDKQVVWDHMQRRIVEEEAEHAEMQARAVKNVEARIASMQMPRIDAIRAIIHEQDENDDAGFAEYRLCLPYGYLEGELSRTE